MTIKIKIFIAFIIILAFIAGGIIGSFVIKKNYDNTGNNNSLTDSYFDKEGVLSFLLDLYSNNESSFKLSKTSSAGLGATYYALMIAKIAEIDLSKHLNVDRIFNNILSYYNGDYYMEEKNDPILSTRMVLEIDKEYAQDLYPEISRDWLENNSLKNNSLDSYKFDPQYQLNILKNYRNSSRKDENIEEIINSYLSYYCDYDFSKINNNDYIRTKYYQTLLISYISEQYNCLNQKNIQTDKEKLEKYSFQDLDNIKDIFRLYYLKKFYNLEINPIEVFVKLNEFYLDGSFKENLEDKDSSLIGTFYGYYFDKIYFSDLRKSDISRFLDL